MAINNDEFEKILAGLGAGWQWDKGAWWLATETHIDVRAVTQFMLNLGARFVAITAIERPDKEIRLDYQWDLDGRLLCFVTATEQQRICTIADLSPAADWVERETREYFAVEFTGRPNTLPLMTRTGDPLGISLHRKEEISQ